MLNMKRARLTALATASVLALGVAGTASAQTDQQGLVNVAIVDTQVAVPVAIAANICDVNVGVLAQQERAGGAACDATADSLATHNQGPGGGGGTADQGGVAQDGLVNVAIVDTQVAVPVAVAANICDLNVGILARQLRLGGAECDADADSMATKGPGAGGGLLGL